MAVKKHPARARPGDTAEPLLQALPEETWRDVFGITKRADRELGDKLVTALQKIDRGLLPPATTHPFEAQIAAGRSGLAPLLDLLDSGSERDWFNALDAVAHICFALTAGDSDDDAAVADDVLTRLRAQLQRRDLDPDKLVLVV